MNPSPYLILCGQAGSGKDAAASCLKARWGAVLVAQADPMKRFCRDAFGFTEQQLWGPSSCRNAPDERFQGYAGFELWEKVEQHVRWNSTSWIKQVFGDGPRSDVALFALRKWISDLREQHSNRVLTPRYALQTIGTEMGRSVDADVWSLHALKTLKALLSGGHAYSHQEGLTTVANAPQPQLGVITDGRFQNELLNVKAVGGTTWVIQDPDAEAHQTVEGGKEAHVSETLLGQVPARWFDVAIHNDKKLGMVQLASNVDTAMKAVYGARLSYDRHGRPLL